MNCGCLPGFPGENRKQLLNAIVRQEALVGGDFETFQKRAWEIARGSNKTLSGRGFGGPLLYLGRGFYSSSIFSLLWVRSDGTSSFRGIRSVGEAPVIPFFFVLVSSFSCFLLSLGAVGGCGFGAALCCSVSIHMPLSTTSFHSLEPPRSTLGSCTVMRV